RHEIERIEPKDLRIYGPRVGPDNFRAFVGDIAAAKLDGAAVDIHQGQSLDPFRAQNRMGEQAKAATEIGPASGKFRQMANEKGASRIDSIPGEHARLGPQAERIGKARRAGGDGGFNGGLVTVGFGGADTMV